MISMHIMDRLAANESNKRLIVISIMSWLSIIGFDFFLHAGILARLYVKPSPFLLPSAVAFKLIPVGYMSFLLMAILLTWIMYKLEIIGKKRGLFFGLKFGGFVWGALVLGLLSISTADYSLIVGWLFGQTLELGVAGTVIGLGLSGKPLKNVFLTVIKFTFFSVIITVIYQNLALI